MKDKKQLKKIPKPELKPITNWDIISKHFPKTKISLANYYGTIVLSDIEIEITKPVHWRDLQFFYTKVLPQAIPPSFEQITKNKKKKQHYLG